MTGELLAFLRSDHLSDIIEVVIGELDGKGLTPRLVERAASLLPEAEQQWRPLMVDLALGTAKARTLGKAHDGWLYTTRMAEQATHPAIADHHARRLGSHEVAIEICTGAAHDALALARSCERVVTFEADATIAAISQVNLERSSAANVTVLPQAWSSSTVVDGRPTAVFADPSRRTEAGGRSRSVADHHPPPGDVLAWAERISPEMRTGIKLGPADDISTLIDRRTAVEYLGMGRECREAVVWRGLSLPRKTVTLVDLASTWSPTSNDSPFESELTRVSFLVEPHAAVIAAGLVDEYFAELDLTPIDPMIAYGVAETEPPSSPFHDRFSVLHIDRGVSDKRIRKRLEELQWGSGTEFKKRGWPGDPESLRTLISSAPDSTPDGVVFIARTDDGHVTIYARRMVD